MELEGPGEGEVGHQEDAKHGVHDCENHNQSIEAIPHFFPENRR